MSETTAPVLRASDFQADPATRDANEAKFARSGTAVEPCFLCGRPLTQKAYDAAQFLHLRTDGTLIPVAEEDTPAGDDQGWFPLGSECARRIPATHKARQQF